MSDWISLKKELPEPNRLVLVINEDRNIAAAEYHAITDQFVITDFAGGWQYGSCKIIEETNIPNIPAIRKYYSFNLKRITHWLYLELPKEEFYV